ncbi:MAG: hypothetical protein AAF921_24280 [Cyanobacteria bacterium P01_D01_bin.44]
MIQPTPPVIAALFAQFRDRYPAGGLMTELLMLHENQHIVRATVTLDGVALVTAMTADPDLEKAEALAQIKVLTLMGISADELKSHGRIPSPQDIIPKNEPSDGAELPTAAPAAAISPGAVSLEDIAIPPEEEALDMPLDEVTDLLLPTLEQPDLAKPSVPGQPASSLATTAIETFDSSTSPVDLSDIIAQTDVEMARLGWSSRQGREYLEQTYGKRSRQQLTDEELLAFLLHLESQPTPSVR